MRNTFFYSPMYKVLKTYREFAFFARINEFDFSLGGLLRLVNLSYLTRYDFGYFLRWL